MHMLLGCLGPSLVCAYTDLKYEVVPHSAVLFMLVYGLIYAGFAGNITASLIGAGLGFFVTYIFWRLRGIGGGDVKLCTALGSWFGYDILVVILIGSLILLIVGCVKMARDDRLREFISLQAKTLSGLLLYGTFINTAPQLPEDVTQTHPDAWPFGVFLVVGAFVVYALQLALKGGIIAWQI